MNHLNQRRRQHAPSLRGERRGIQIGPRIRIGGSVGKVLGKVQKFVPDFRTMVAGAASPVLGFATSAANGTLGSDLRKGATNAAAILGGKAALNGGVGSAAQSLFSLGGGGDDSGGAAPAEGGMDPWMDFDKRNTQWLDQYAQQQQRGQRPTNLGFGAQGRPWYAP